MPDESSEFTLEKLAIHKRLEAVERSLARLEGLIHSELGGNGNDGNLRKNIEDLTASVRKILDKHDKEIYGNGGEGLKVKVDRISTAFPNHEIADRWLFGLLFVLCSGTFAIVIRMALHA